MPWIVLSFFPGFTEDLTSWRTEIYRDGRLTQKVRIVNSSERRDEWHELLLTRAQLRNLEKRIATTDFTAISRICERDILIEDAGRMIWEIEIADDQVHRMEEPLLALRWMQKEGDMSEEFAVKAALQLWKAIDRLAPFNLKKLDEA